MRSTGEYASVEDKTIVEAIAAFKRIGKQFRGEPVEAEIKWGFDEDPPATDDGEVYVRRRHNCAKPNMVVGHKTVVVKEGFLGFGRKTEVLDIFVDEDAVWTCPVCFSMWEYDLAWSIYGQRNRVWRIKERTHKWVEFTPD